MSTIGFPPGAGQTEPMLPGVCVCVGEQFQTAGKSIKRGTLGILAKPLSSSAGDVAICYNPAFANRGRLLCINPIVGAGYSAGVKLANEEKICEKMMCVLCINCITSL